MAIEQVDFYFTTGPTGGDGIICDAKSGHTWPTEHVMVPDLKTADVPSLEDRVLEQIKLKVGKGGAAYASGKTLLVFLNAGAGVWKPNRIARQLPSPLHFDTVWTMGLQGVVDGAYIYAVANINIAGGNAPTWPVTRISYLRKLNASSSISDIGVGHQAASTPS